MDLNMFLYIRVPGVTGLKCMRRQVSQSLRLFLHILIVDINQFWIFVFSHSDDTDYFLLDLTRWGNAYVRIHYDTL